MAWWKIIIDIGLALFLAILKRGDEKRTESSHAIRAKTTPYRKRFARRLAERRLTRIANAGLRANGGDTPGPD